MEEPRGPYYTLQGGVVRSVASKRDGRGPGFKDGPMGAQKGVALTAMGVTLRGWEGPGRCRSLAEKMLGPALMLPHEASEQHHSCSIEWSNETRCPNLLSPPTKASCLALNFGMAHKLFNFE